MGTPEQIARAAHAREARVAQREERQRQEIQEAQIALGRARARRSAATSEYLALDDFTTNEAFNLQVEILRLGSRVKQLTEFLERSV